MELFIFKENSGYKKIHQKLTYSQKTPKSIKTTASKVLFFN